MLSDVKYRGISRVQVILVLSVFTYQLLGMFFLSVLIFTLYNSVVFAYIYIYIVNAHCMNMYILPRKQL